MRVELDAMGKEDKVDKETEATIQKVLDEIAVAREVKFRFLFDAERGLVGFEVTMEDFVGYFDLPTERLKNTPPKIAKSHVLKAMERAIELTKL